MNVRYRVEKTDGEALGKPQALEDALATIERRLKLLPDGETLRTRKVVYELPPEGPPGSTTVGGTAEYTGPMLKGYRAVVARSPKVGWMGGFVCKFASGTQKTTSQHAVKTSTKPSAGNAIDWAAPDHIEAEGSKAVIDWLWDLANWIVKEAKAGRRPTSEVIFRDRKWTPTRGWRAYSGPFHAAHVHESAAPYVEAHAACLDD